MPIEKKLSELDNNNVTDKFLMEIADNAYPVCAIFSMG